MNRALRLAYGTAAHLARAAALVAPAQGAKWQRSLHARRGIRTRYEAWARRRDLARPLLWIHAPSVGEGLQARVVVDLVRARRPDIQLAYTFFSPSAEPFARSLGTDFADYLPFDTLGDARVVLDALQPSALVFSKLDVWPILVEEASRRGVALGMISGTLSAVSSRRGSLATGLLHESYARLDLVGAVSEDDAARLARLGVPNDRLVITGDTRYDQAARRARETDMGSPLLAPLRSHRPTLVAGSTWPADEEVLLPAWEAVRRDIPNARLIIAAHEPRESHTHEIEKWTRSHNLVAARVDDAHAALADVVIVNRVGVLGYLYALADAAYVGGGFHAAGLHSVLEPAAFGAPVAFGPNHMASRDAVLLMQRGGGDAVGTPDETIELLLHWLGDRSVRAAAGGAARALVESGIGAGERSYELVMSLLAKRHAGRQ